MANEAKLLTLVQTANFIGQLTGHRPSPVAVWRWCRHGLVSRSGERVNLGHSRVGHKLFVYADSIEPFFKSLANSDRAYFTIQRERAEATQTLGPPPKRSPKAKADAVAKARRSLETATR